MSMSTTCFVCSVETATQCSQCGQASFCDLHRDLHRDERGCFPVRVHNTANKGRILVTSRDVRAGELLFSEKPIVSGPSKSATNQCIVCLKKLPPSPEWNCPRCRFPTCSDSCAASHSSQEECAAMASATLNNNNNNNNSFSLEAVLTLRTLLLKSGDPERWQKVQAFCDHVKDLKNDPARWSHDQTHVVDRIRLDWSQTQFEEEEVRRVEGILFVNALEQPSDREGRFGGRALFPLTSFCSHDCVNNAFRKIKTKDDHGDDVIGDLTHETRAKVDIPAGSEVSLHYCGGLRGRALRRAALHRGWFFLCDCHRCRSPDELGSHMSTLTCCRCVQEDVSKISANSSSKNPQLLSPLDCSSLSSWFKWRFDLRPVAKTNVVPEIDKDGFTVAYKCQGCQERFTCEYAATLEQSFQSALDSIPSSDARAVANLLNSVAASQLHKRHFLVLASKWTIINSLGRRDGLHYSQLTDEDLALKLDCCSDYLTALDVVDPGISHNRGITLWELYSVHAFVLQRSFQSGSMTPRHFLAGLRVAEDVLRHAETALQHSQEGSFEAGIVGLANKAAKATKEAIDMCGIMLMMENVKV